MFIFLFIFRIYRSVIMKVIIAKGIESLHEAMLKWFLSALRRGIDDIEFFIPVSHWLVAVRCIAFFNWGSCTHEWYNSVDSSRNIELVEIIAINCDNHSRLPHRAFVGGYKKDFQNRLMISKYREQNIANKISPVWICRIQRCICSL